MLLPSEKSIDWITVCEDKTADTTTTVMSLDDLRNCNGLQIMIRCKYSSDQAWIHSNMYFSKEELAKIINTTISGGFNTVRISNDLMIGQCFICNNYGSKIGLVVSNLIALDATNVHDMSMSIYKRT